MSVALALQKAIRSRLAGAPSVTALVPASNILDRHQRPAPTPSIILGEAMELDAETDLQRRRLRVVHTVHVWKTEPSLEGVATICGAVRDALRTRLALPAGLHLADLRVAGMRTMRDPDGETSHGAVTIEALVEEVA